MKSLNLIYYSPTRTTQKIVREIGKNIGLEIISDVNIADRENNTLPQINKDSLTIIGMPVYAGRLPINAVEAIEQLKANGTPVVIVVVYGNRDYDDALLELKDIANKDGFKIVAGAAFIGEHSFSSNDKPIAKGRPDQQDLNSCIEFAQQITKKLATNTKLNLLSELTIPGNFPYKERNKLPTDIYPETDLNLCTNCGECVEICPTGAISLNGTISTNGKLCTWCFACVKFCRNEARIFNQAPIIASRERLFANFSERKEPVYFI